MLALLPHQGSARRCCHRGRATSTDTTSLRTLTINFPALPVRHFCWFKPPSLCYFYLISTSRWLCYSQEKDWNRCHSISHNIHYTLLNPCYGWPLGMLASVFFFYLEKIRWWTKFPKDRTGSRKSLQRGMALGWQPEAWSSVLFNFCHLQFVQALSVPDAIRT